jgi:hypothetical protein
MTQTVFGPVFDQCGFSVRTELVQGEHGPLLHRHAEATPAHAVRRVQPADVPVTLSHGGEAVGEAVFFELTPRFLMAVAHVSDDIGPLAAVKVGDETRAVPVDVFWSSQRDSRLDGTDTIITELTLTTSPRQRGLEPLTWLDGELDHRYVVDERWHLRARTYEHGLLTRAANSYLDRRARGGGALVVHDTEREREFARLELRGLDPATAMQLADDLAYDRRPPGPLRHGALVKGSVLRVG